MGMKEEAFHDVAYSCIFLRRVASTFLHREAAGCCGSALKARLVARGKREKCRERL